MGSNGSVNSIEVAVLCLMQKIMNEQDAWSSKMTVEIHARANILRPLPQSKYCTKRSSQLHPLHTQNLHPTAPPRNYKILLIK